MRLRPYLQITGFVVAWMCIGWLFRLPPVEYLILGVPLTIVFQLFVRGQPLVNLWIRDSSRIYLGPVGLTAAIGFAFAPAQALYLALAEGAWVRATYFLVASVGSLGVGFALQHIRRCLSLHALGLFGIATVLGLFVMAGGALINSVSPAVALSRGTLPAA